MSKKKTTLTAKEPKGLTFEEKVNQIAAVVPKEESLTEVEEYNIITNKGIEYILTCANKEDLKIYIAPIKLGQYKLFYELDAVQQSAAPIMDKLEMVAKLLAEILNIDQKLLEQYVDQDDVVVLTQLLSVGVLMGKSMFKKKRLSQLEIQRFLSQTLKQNLG